MDARGGGRIAARRAPTQLIQSVCCECRFDNLMRQYGMAVFPNDPTATIPDRIKGLIFDCDGTLVDSMRIHYSAWKEAMEAVNIEISQKRFYSLAGVPTLTIVQTLAKEQNVTCDVQAAAENKERLYLAKIESIEPIHRVVEIVR